MRILKRVQAGYCLFLLVGFLLCGFAQARGLPAAVKDALTRAAIPTHAVGTYVQEVSGTSPLLAANATVPFNPASTMKLVTSNAALEILGPTFSWKTQAYATGVQTGDILQGDLIFKGSGDPKLVTENFWLFLRQIRAKGIREIRGNLLLDRSVFDEQLHDPGQFDGDVMKPYNAGPDALLLNFQALRFRFLPDAARGVVQVAVDPPVAGYPIVAPTLTTGECADWQGKLRAEFGAHGVKFGGTYAVSCGERTWYVHPHPMTHTQYFDAVFRQLWTDLGGAISGEVRSGLAGPDARLIAEWESPTLPEVIRDLNKYSNNVMARQLLLTLAANRLKLPANPERGALVVKSWLANKGIDAPELIIENGAGLSRIERISAATLGRLLVAAFQAPTMPEFMSSLPLVGYDGTMRRRLKDQGVAGHAHIKTGRLDDVRTLAGYVLAASGKRYVVVSLINHDNAARGQEAQDLLLQWVYEHG